MNAALQIKPLEHAPDFLFRYVGAIVSVEIDPGVQMAETSDFEDLAGRYMDLWREHLSDLAADGEIAEAIAKYIELMNGSALAFAAMGRSEGDTDGNANKTSPKDGTATAGTEAPVPAHGRSDADMGKLADRIEELERRITELESKAQESGA